MYLLDGKPVLSASDVVNFAGCVHRTCLDREVALGLRERPVVIDPFGEILIRAGMAHEADQLALLRLSGLDIVEVTSPPPGRAGLVEAKRLTLEAMQAGRDLIYQGS